MFIFPNTIIHDTGNVFVHNTLIVFERKEFAEAIPDGCVALSMGYSLKNKLHGI